MTGALVPCAFFNSPHAIPTTTAPATKPTPTRAESIGRGVCAFRALDDDDARDDDDEFDAADAEGNAEVGVRPSLS